LETRLQFLIDQARKEITEITSLNELQSRKSHYIGKKSPFTELMKQLKELPKEERPEFGKKINIAKNQLQLMITEKESSLKQLAYETSLSDNIVDITMPGRRRNKGALNPINKVWREIEDVFISMGFDVAEGYDIEDEFHNFDALNTPQDHPARDLSDTFYIDNNILLRTQTSTVQIRVMENLQSRVRKLILFA